MTDQLTGHLPGFVCLKKLHWVLSSSAAEDFGSDTPSSLSTGKPHVILLRPSWKVVSLVTVRQEVVVS